MTAVTTTVHVRTDRRASTGVEIGVPRIIWRRAAY
ncbi:hypothetical protein MAR_027136 [Mya arenaria]|nr:hypothetical protein MAR_027116 [Mya arenaria]WAR12940.1 hypothetical protein MAR_027120 [Mya arenaria]WAR12951.1 hypothetical protein MAR_027131 [Mya arenaria]WAR12956.1 hypothetical protein MAR_027136 [Mya arenaria]